MIAKIISKLLRQVADQLDAGNCELSEQEAAEIAAMITHQALSKEQATQLLGVSRATFDERVRLGILPKGRKRVGFKELVWYRDELLASSSQERRQA